jgi:methyl acetate hydrolase
LGALLKGGEIDGARILKPETIALMGQNHIGKLEAGSMKTVNRQISRDVDFFPNSADRFGFGFLINTESVPGGRASGSLAWAGVYNTYFWLDPKNGICGVLMTQILPFFDSRVLILLSDFEREVYSYVGR